MVSPSLQQRHGKLSPFPKELDIKTNLVDTTEILGSCIQSPNDYMLHSTVVIVLIADSRPINMLRKNKSERQLAGIEMRRRIVIQLQTRTFMFEVPNIKKKRRTKVKE